MKKINIIFLVVLLFNSCTTTPKEDPLKNTKKLFIEGHTSLYKNGAFNLPSTQVYLIPPGPGPVALASDLMGVKAKASFLLALQSAKDSVSVVSVGTKKTFEIAGSLSESGKSAREYIQSSARPFSKFIILKSSEAGKEIMGQAWDNGAKTKKSALAVKESLANDRKNVEISRAKFRETINAAAKELEDNSNKELTATRKAVDQSYGEAKKDWILGYAFLDQKLTENQKTFENKKSLERFTKTAEKSEIKRQKGSSQIYYLFDGSFKKASEETAQDFSNAKQEFQVGENTYGYSLATLRALGWWLKGTVWNCSVAAGKTVVGGVGYILFNGVAYPVVVGAQQAANSIFLAVEYSQLKLSNTYEYVAPTTSLALAGIILSAKSAAAQVKSASYKTAAVITKTAGAGATETAAALEKTGLYAAEKAVQYVGVPLTTATATTGTALSGAFVMTSGYVAGGISRAGGEISAYTADGLAKTAAGVTGVVGTAGSVTAGAAVGVFEVGQAVVVPPTLALGSGIALTYGLATQLSAQALLSVADAAYLVLSLEGGKYVVYAVTGLVDPQEDIPAGTVIDLDELRKRGEEIKKVPLSDEEIKKLTDSADKNY